MKVKKQLEPEGLPKKTSWYLRAQQQHRNVKIYKCINKQTATKINFIKTVKHNKHCLAKIGYQSEYPTVTIDVTGTPLIACSAMKYGQQNCGLLFLESSH